MRLVAREMNLSETAFLHPDGSGGHHLRWFTPGVEVKLCGHATLASAHYLWESGKAAPGETLRFHTLSGLLTATKKGELIELDFPAKLVTQVAAPPGLFDALGVLGSFVGQSALDYMVEVESEEIVRRTAPDVTKLRSIPVRGVIVTAKSVTREFDFVSRFFAPSAGVDEDPVTGSAHCSLGPYWAAQLSKNELKAYQASARGGVVQVTVRGDRVLLAGKAVTVLRGEMIF